MTAVEKIILTLAYNTVVRLVVVAVVMDTIFGIGRAIREHKFNSSVGIDGAIRKICMIISIVFMGVVDVLVHINLIGFLPEEVRSYLPTETVGLAEFFGLLYLCYEIVSILKNMALCGLPVKGLWKKVQAFLGKYTEELPDTEEQDAKQEALLGLADLYETKGVIKLQEGVTLTDTVPPRGMEPNEDGTYNTYDQAGNKTGTVTAEEYEKAGEI